jgi:RNA polymerase nonessential primary-like sigma factor
VPSSADIARHLERSTADIERLLALHECFALGSTVDDERSPLDTIAADRDGEPARCVDRDHVHALLDDWVFRLGDKQRAVVERRFGLNGCSRCTLEQIGHEIGETRERVRQIQLDALRSLKQMMERDGIGSESLLD